MQRALNARKDTRIGTWNTRGLRQTGKLHIVEREALAGELDVLSIAETHWRGEGHFRTKTGNTVYFSGSGSESRNGVALMISGPTAKAVLGYEAVNDRIITIKIKSRPININVIQVYAPTAELIEEEIEAFYDKLSRTINALPKQEIHIILGDLNAKIGQATTTEDSLKQILGPFGLGTRNARGERMLQFCQEQNLAVANTLFQNHNRRLYTWKSPGDRYRNQINYIMVKSRWKSSIRSCKTYPGADCGSDHQLLVMQFKVRLKNIKLPQKKAINIPGSRKEKFREGIQSELMKGKMRIMNNQNPNKEWEMLKDIINENTERLRHDSTFQTNKHWITQGTLVTIRERKEIKSRGILTEEDGSMYRNLSRKIQRQCRQDKNNHIREICREIEEHRFTNDTRDLYKKVRELTRKFKPKIITIEDKDGKVIWEEQKILERWKQYCEELYSEKRDQTNEVQMDDMQHEKEPDVLLSEIKEAIRDLKTNKAPGADGITAEVIKELGDNGAKILQDICNKIWHSEHWPKDWAKSAFIPIHKKGSTRKCQNYRTIALISHASKILLRILDQRLRRYLDYQIPPEQAGFVKGKGTKNQIFNIRQLIEKAREFNMPMLLCFIDYKKAFDCVKWNYLWRVLREMGVPHHLMILIRNLY